MFLHVRVFFVILLSILILGGIVCLLSFSTGTTLCVTGAALPLREPRDRVSSSGMISIGTLLPEEDAVVIKDPENGRVLYRLRADSSEWVADGITHEWVQGVLFQARCATTCL